MTNQQIILSTLRQHLPELIAKYPIVTLYLFGSVVRDDFDPQKSDIDILVDYKGTMSYNFIELAEELEKITGKKIDLVSKRALKPRHWEYIKDQLVHV